MAAGTKKNCGHDIGSIFVSLITFALPLMAGSVFQLLYNTTDLIFVGNFLGTTSAAVGASGLWVNMPDRNLYRAFSRYECRSSPCSGSKKNERGRRTGTNSNYIYNDNFWNALNSNWRIYSSCLT